MNPQQLNKAIAELVYPECDWELLPSGVICLVDECSIDQTYLDYCNNWDDLMPLVIEHLLNDCKALTVTDCAVMTSNQGSKLNGLTLDIEDETLQIALAQCVYKVLLAKKESEDG